MSSVANWIRTEPEKLLTIGQELGLLREACRKSPALRPQLANMLMIAEQFDEVIALLGSEKDLAFGEATRLTHAYLAQETEADTRSAIAASNLAFDIAENDEYRASALAARGKCEMRLGDFDAAGRTLRQALALDPHNKDACKRIVALELDAQRPDAAIAISDELLSAGAAHARLFAARSVAFARVGDIDAAHVADGAEHFRHVSMLPPPPGWDSIEAFNEALVEELLTHPAMRYERYGSASNLTWRIENLPRSDRPLIDTLLGQIIGGIDAHIGRISATDHPWFASRPERAILRNWCVITESDGFESWHVHQFGWLSGVYYVQIPDSIAKGNSESGCIAFGLPEDLAGDEGSARFGQQLLRPQSGLMATFPSHSYHRTFPHGMGGKRICIAFDVRPY